MVNRRQLGKEYEDRATKILEENGYKIIKKNYFGRYGEIDIIAQKKNLLAIVEVKFRKTRKYGEGIEAVDIRKIRRMYKTAKEFIYKKKLYDMDIYIFWTVRSLGLRTLRGVMKLDFKCIKCGCDKYQVKTTILPEKSPGLKLEFGTYYIKTCLNCGYTEIYSAKIVNMEKMEKHEKPCPEF